MASARTAFSRIPAQAWVRPGIVLAGGAAFTVMLILAQWWWLAIPVALTALFMAYAACPLRSGPHLPFATAMQQVEHGHLVVVWAPGATLSSRLQAAIRERDERVLWVNAYQDAEATEFASQHGGWDALPLVISSTRVHPAVTVGEFVDLQASLPLPPLNRRPNPSTEPDSQI